MNTARVSLCLALLLSWTLAGPAVAQQFTSPGQTSMMGYPEDDDEPGTDDLHTRSIFDNRNYMLRSDAGDGVGYLRGYQTFAAFQPIIVDPNELIFWTSPRGYVTYNSGNFAGNLGAGVRWLNPDNQRILGGGFWWDHDNNGITQYDQLGGGVEWLGNLLDFRANVYFPTNQNRHVTAQFFNFQDIFIGHNIGLGQTTIANSALRGGDFESGGALPGIGDLGMRAYAGGYYYQGPQSGGGIYGVRGRLEALITQDLWATVAVSHDRVFGTNVTAAATWYLGTGNAPRFMQRIPMQTRLYQQMERQYRVAVQQEVENDFVLALRAGGTGGSGGPVGTPIFVDHVNNTAPAGGDGSVEHPFNHLPTSTPSNVDVIFVRRGDGTSNNMNQGITLNDFQRLLGDGIQHLFTALQGTFVLPGFTPGPFPTITNINPGGSAVTLASHNEVSGFNINRPALHGITGTGITDFNINNVNINNAGGNGIVITGATGNGNISSVNVNASALDGIQLASAGPVPLNVDMESDTSNNNGRNGVNVTLTNNAVLNLTLNNSTINANGINGFLMTAGDNTLANATITNNTFTGNPVDGISFALTGNNLTSLNVVGNTIHGIGGASVLFFINGDTFTNGWSLTNTSANGGPALTDFNFDLSTAFPTAPFFLTGRFFNTAPPKANVPFAPLGGTDVTTGLFLVNGNGKPFTVPNDQPILDMKYNNFTPGKTFRWAIDVDTTIASDDSVLGNQLAGSTIHAAFSNGQTLSGVLQLVPGLPEASNFVASAAGGGSHDGIHVNMAGNSQLQNSHIVNNTVLTNGRNGINVEMAGTSSIGAGGLTINRNAVTANGTIGNGGGINISTTDAAQIAAGRLIIDQNSIQQNQVAGINFSNLAPGGVLTGALLNAEVQGNTINANSGFGIQSMGFAGTTNINIGGAGPGQGNTITGNQGAGITFQLKDLGVGSTNIIGNSIQGTVAANPASTTFLGQGIDIRTTGSTVSSNATASFTGGIIDGNLIGTTTGNAGGGITVFADQNTSLQNLQIGTLPSPGVRNGNTIENNTGDGINIQRNNVAHMGDIIPVSVNNNLIENNTGNGVSITARNSFDGIVNGFSLNNNTITNNGINGVALQVEADANMSVDIIHNLISNNSAAGIVTTEVVSSAFDLRGIAGTWDRNTITLNGADGIHLAAASAALVIGSSAGNGNIIQHNAAHGILINGAGTASIGFNLIDSNPTGGIYINAATFNDYTITHNTITNNGTVSATADGGDGIQIVDGGGGSYNVTITNNDIRNNAGRGINILNRGPFPFSGALSVDIENNVIKSNNLEGVYVVNTSSPTQTADVLSTAALLSDGALNAKPVLFFTLNNNDIEGNGIGSTFTTTGLVMRVGTSDGGRSDFTDDGGFFNGGVRGGVGATVTNNIFHGNRGDDVYFASFTSTVAPAVTGGTWSATQFAPTGYQSDPLARLDLLYSGNLTDSTAFNNANATGNGTNVASYNTSEPQFKSRTTGATDPGPFLNAARERNAERLGGRFGLPPATPGGASDTFLYPGIGTSTFRLLSGSDPTNFDVDAKPYTNPFTDAAGAGPYVPLELMPYGWSLQ
ncbi:MAG TPA: right-handed parallel beta-helix repeat-containing protein [Planctomycetaceae bacterium]|nr:right-handed parallel beta-helix repeat-containing protein [Planctomycetaceae bacterium]